MEAKVLAGPILRRTTKHRVCVWLAASLPMRLQLTVMDAADKPLGQSSLEKLEEQRVQLGTGLYVYLLQAGADDAAGYPLDAWLYYRIERVESNSRTALFTDEELARLTYGSHRHPSFFMPSALRRILHGSCRKPHGGFNPRDEAPMPDALSLGDALLKQTCHDMEKRPALLLLTGDQIYADDVAISLLAMLRPQAVALTGRQEMLPLADGAAGLPPLLDPSTIPLHGRAQALHENHAGFSSDAMENHLCTFGEFAAMYVYVFGNMPGWEPVWGWEALRRLGVAAGEAGEHAEKACTGQAAPLRSFHNTLQDVRRLLANVPTYMICDDHDVTDDWNITESWYDAVRNSPPGRRIVSNALAAYWAFQAWGNDPDNFAKDLILTIRQQLADTRNDPDIGERYDLHLWKARGWGFSVPTEPPIIAIDSRTQRQYENPYYPAQLLDRYALDWLRVEWAKLKTGQAIGEAACPVLITTTPVAGYATVEAIQHLLLWLAGKVESYVWVNFIESLADAEGFITGWLVNKLDAESWAANREGYANFMDTLCLRMGLSHCVFLSGDVHYGFTANARYTRRDGTLQYRQLTSSSMCNEPDEMQARFLEKTARHRTGKYVHRNFALLPSRRWKAEVEMLRVQGSGERVISECNLGLVEFAGGVPVSHTLLSGAGDFVFSLA